MRRLLVLIAMLAALTAVAGCGEDERESAGTPNTATQDATPEAPGTPADAGCSKVDPPKPKGEQKRKKPTLKLGAGKTYSAKVVTSCGEFTIQLDARRAPRTGGAFVTLARDGFFDGTTFHRISKGFVIQGGDPAGDGSGGPGFTIVEAPPEDLQYVRGVVAMAKTELDPPGASGSQFFVVTGETTPLPPDYALLGEVTEGMETVDKIAAVETMPPEDGQPTEPILIESITIEES